MLESRAALCLFQRAIDPGPKPEHPQVLAEDNAPIDHAVFFWTIVGGLIGGYINHKKGYMFLTGFLFGQTRVAQGKLVEAAEIGAAAERALRQHKGYRYYAWEIREGAFVFFEHPVRLAAEKRLEGRYVIATTEKDITGPEAVAHYKQLTEVERSFRHLKDVLALRPIYHQVEPRVKAHIFVAALALLLQTPGRLCPTFQGRR